MRPGAVRGSWACDTCGETETDRVATEAQSELGWRWPVHQVLYHDVILDPDCELTTWTDSIGLVEHVARVLEANDWVVVRREEMFCNISVGGRRLTWRERAAELQQVANRARGLADLLLDLNRCEHGRHEGDACEGCADFSTGNPVALGPTASRVLDVPERTIGFGPEGLPIVVPERARVHDPDAWRYDRPLCEGDAADG